MRYLYLAVLIAGSAALTGCFNDSSDTVTRIDDQTKLDQAKAKLAVSTTDAVIGASRNVDTDEPQDISRVILPEANLAEPVAINNANASL